MKHALVHANSNGWGCILSSSVVTEREWPRVLFWTVFPCLPFLNRMTHG
jgi:hypothetical protein